ncbi:short chain dehydrogenase [Klebsiella pneumoniae]|nr:short-chain dehydrogenase [Acinetobacter baumannii]SSW75548.1 short chain dehydrogenase [Klebsiella pneumoniae]
MANAPYAASKAAVEMLGRCLRTEIAYTGATASVVYPGWTATPIAKVAFGGNATVTKMIEAAFPAWLRKPISPEYMAQAIVKGVQRRQPRIFAPVRWVPFSILRGMFSVASDAMVIRHKKLQGLLQQLESESKPVQK